MIEWHTQLYKFRHNVNFFLLIGVFDEPKLTSLSSFTLIDFQYILSILHNNCRLSSQLTRKSGNRSLSLFICFHTIRSPMIQFGFLLDQTKKSLDWFEDWIEVCNFKVQTTEEHWMVWDPLCQTSWCDLFLLFNNGSVFICAFVGFCKK